MKRFLLGLITLGMQLFSYLFIYDFLQTLLNKLFRSDLYVLFIMILLGIAPLFIFILVNNIFCKKYYEKCSNIFCTNILFIIFNAIYCFFFLSKDKNFGGLSLFMYGAWFFVVSAVLFVYYSFKIAEENQSADGTVTDNP